MAVTCLYLTRNPTGTVSLAIIAAGAALHMDKVAVAMSKKAMGALQRVGPAMAQRIRSEPGGADGLTCAFTPSYVAVLLKHGRYPPSCHRVPAASGSDLNSVCTRCATVHAIGSHCLVPLTFSSEWLMQIMYSVKLSFLCDNMLVLSDAYEEVYVKYVCSLSYRCSVL